ncbi:hypothetical protein IG631_00020 [Alternaria alternata]|nr:hypothetical protein IG631_00020 [Alternaria alternata]
MILQVVVSEGLSAIQYQLSENHVEQNALLRQVLENKAKLSRTPENWEKKNQEVKSKSDVGDHKFQPLREHKKFLEGKPGVFPSWIGAHQENSTQNEDIVRVLECMKTLSRGFRCISSAQPRGQGCTGVVQLYSKAK